MVCPPFSRTIREGSTYQYQPFFFYSCVYPARRIFSLSEPCFGPESLPVLKRSQVDPALRPDQVLIPLAGLIIQAYCHKSRSVRRPDRMDHVFEHVSLIRF